MKMIFAILIVLSLTSCREGSAHLDAQVKTWDRTITQDLPVGSSTVQIEQWGKVHKIHFTHRPEDHQFSANVEKFPVTGIRFPCTNWNVIVLIKLDQSGHSTKNNVYGVGDCL